ncbi:recombinase family protein [Novosphingobium sp. H3SJ31-1]|uniref:Recombinase family protein n=1 Tax=Novosphingobium album (ex Liu et al. 2023) TaxID=3031130 RepID=A0ABT5WVF5_9SPHN|nr:recombinase family protein [Novosphingobium album (ex Liu et al. 2023)]MDE8653883.1 recombinase family protein [Novosphingobium album (ex Liu et al. 2023)]
MLYARVSTRDQEKEGYSIPAQVKLLEDYAALNGLIIASSHVDVETARKAGRTAFGEMLRYLRRHPEVRILLVEKTDRLYRNIKDWAIIDDLGIEVHFVKENFILSDDCRSSEKFMHGIKVLMAKSYIDNLSEEATKGMAEKARQGLWPSIAPFGYANVIDPSGRKVVVVDPEIGPLVTLLYDWFASGRYTLTSITRKARLAGIKGRRSRNPIASATIYRILRNRFYAGVIEWGEAIHEGVHEPLISKALWDAVQDILDGRSSTNIRANPREFAFSGLIKCGHCGCAAVAEIKKERYIYYHCTGYRGKCPERYVREEVLEERFTAVLDRLRCTDAEFNLMQQAILAGQPAIDPDELDRRYRKKGHLFPAPGALMRNAIAYLDMGRRAHRSLASLPTEDKRQMLGLILSECFWANGELSVAFHRPFELLVAWLRQVRCGSGTDFAHRPSAALREMFQDPSPGVRRLIARYNAMVAVQADDGAGEAASIQDNWLLEGEAA